ncbi:chaoptin [Nephila pilipes]|uniref:Chaoptin n=1 Tax=Nephila pilipes TaxID=299642 RepID=A0A8X6N7N5_NEPPI|nr:chaoptin [Nephila pilipes]
MISQKYIGFVSKHKLKLKEMKFFDKICLLLFLTNVDSRLKEQHRPCSFNPLCTCSNGGPDLGSVCCHNIPFMTVPSQINNSAIYIMSLKENKLRFLEDNSLNGTGLWKLQINNNLLTDLPSNALAGLEKTLSILDLSKNNLVRIPREAIQNLEKLSNLNLAGNKITYLNSDDFRNLGKTLKLLDLSENALMQVQNDVFRNMISLEVLNLAYNSIISIDDITFHGGLNNLKHIILTGNQLQQIPLNALANFRNIKIVNLNENLISSISEGREIRNRIYLDELHLEHNLIKELTAESFRLFSQVDRIFLKGNPLSIVNDTFLTTNTTEIYMPYCSISVITHTAFLSSTHSLQVLDLSHNELKEFPVLPLTRLTKLSLAGNLIKEVVPEDIKYCGNSLKYLDITGTKMSGLSEESMNYLPNVRELSFNKQYPVVGAESLQNISPSMEKLNMVQCSIKVIENGAFNRLSGLKSLDLSYNTISKIGNTTFKDIKHSLEKLILHSALRISIFPYKALNSLSKLEYLDVSSNDIQYLPYNSFVSFQNLRHLNLNHNELKDLDSNFVNDIHNPNLAEIKVAFNKITSLKSYTFRNLRSLIYLQLNDNLIEFIRKSAFLDLDSIMIIRLEGNSIQTIDSEAFQNLPNIQVINLAYNKLSSFNLEAFNQVGRLSTLRIDVNHNNIQNLTGDYTVTHTSSNIKHLNFSHNNISYLDSNYLDPIRLSVTILDLSYNRLVNLTTLAFTNMAHLQTLILSNNIISKIDEDEFKGLRSIQVLDLSMNNLNTLPENLFEKQKQLRIFLLHHNEIDELPEDIFKATILEQIDLSFNNIEEFPYYSISQIKNTLQFLNLAGNQIEALNFSSIMSLQNLRYLSLSRNRLFIPSSEEDLQLPKLITLDLSHNTIKELPAWIANHLPPSLEQLNLANTSLETVPALGSCNILILNLSSNSIQTVEQEEFEQLKKLQTIDLSNNLLLTTYNNVWSNLQHLKTLYLQKNPIQKLLNNSFMNMERLQELFMKKLKLQEIDQDVFHELTALKKVEMDTFPNKNMDLSQILRNNQGIQEIRLHVQDNGLDGIFNGELPKSLKFIVLEGENLKHLDESIFSYIQSQTLKLNIQNSNITKLSQKVFQNMKEVRNFTVEFINNKLQTLEKLYAVGKEVSGKYLKHLKLSGNQLDCDCELFWIWEWLKEYEYVNKCEERICEETYLHDLRETKCVNMNNRSIINVFKTDLQCVSNGTPAENPKSILLHFFISIVFMLFYIKVVII